MGFQLKSLLHHPLQWTRGIKQAYEEQLQSVWEVRHETLGFFLWNVVAQFFFWVTLKLVQYQFWLPRTEAVLRKVPLGTLLVELSRKAADVKKWRLRQLAEGVAKCPVNQKANVISGGNTKDSVAIPTLKVNSDLGKTPIATYMLVDSGSSVNVVPWKKAKKHDWMIDTNASVLVVVEF